jgi:hypothetical protein
MDDEEYDVSYIHDGREKKRIKGLGKYKTNKLVADLVSSHVFKAGDVMEIWTSNDKNQIPLMIHSPISVGSVKVVLKDHKGLKYDLSSKIK